MTRWVSRQLPELLSSWVGLVERRRWAVIGLSLLAGAGATYYAASHLRLDMDTRDMMSAELPWRRLDIDYSNAFPQYQDNILIVLEAAAPDAALDAARLLTVRLRQHPKLFPFVSHPPSLPYLRRQALLFLEPEDLQTLADRLAEAQPLLARLGADPSLRGLWALLQEAAATGVSRPTPLLAGIDRALRELDTGGPAPFSWQRLLAGEETDKLPYREFVLTRPHLDFGRTLPASDSVALLEELARDPALKRWGVRMRLTGDVMLAHEQVAGLAREMGPVLLLTLTLVVLVLILGLRSGRLVAHVAVTLICSLALTSCLAAATVESLNAISVTFAVLYLGLGVDFGIHYCLRCRELLDEPGGSARNGMRHPPGVAEALCTAAGDTGGALFLCALTTAAGFYAFTFTDYRGIVELGWIAGSGMFVCLAMTLTLLPALIAAFPPAPVPASTAFPPRLPTWLLTLPERRARWFCGAGLVLGAIALAGCLQWRFDYDLLNLQDSRDESVQVLRELLHAGEPAWPLVVVTENAEDARTVQRRLEALPEIERVASVEDFVPADADARLPIIEAIDLLAGGVLAAKRRPPPSKQEQRQALATFVRAACQGGTSASAALSEWFSASSCERLQRLGALPEAERDRHLATLQESLLGLLPGRIEALREALLAAPPTAIEELPPALRSLWITADGRRLVHVYPAADSRRGSAPHALVEKLQALEPRIVGFPVISVEAGNSVQYAFGQALFLAVLAIAILLPLLLERRRDALLVLLPLGLAAGLTGTAGALLDVPLNFTNVIALPLLFGIGIDNAIHVTHRFRRLGGRQPLLGTCAARGVQLSALTTAASAGTLLLVNHAGVVSLGKLLAMGILLSLFCTLTVLPGLLRVFAPPRERSARADG